MHQQQGEGKVGDTVAGVVADHLADLGGPRLPRGSRRMVAMVAMMWELEAARKVLQKLGWGGPHARQGRFNVCPQPRPHVPGPQY